MTDWDSIGADRLRALGSLKWTAFPDTIGAWVAEMDFGVAPPIAAALHAAVDEATFGYLPARLTDGLRDACTGWLADRYGWVVPPTAVNPVPDVLRGLELMLAELSEPGAPVVVPTPAYAPFLFLPPALGREVVEVPMVRSEAGRWVLDEPAIEAALAPRGGVLVVCNPQNPLGRVHTRAELERIAAIVERTGARVFSDEIHAPLVYAPHRHVPYASVSPAAARHTVTAMSASKAWNLAGLKCAQVVLTNPADQRRWDQLGWFASRGASNLGIIANAAAFTAGRPWLAEVVEQLAGNRDLTAERIAAVLPAAAHVPPEATYLAWVDARPLTDRRELAPFLRAAAGVAVTGGEECGAAGAGSFRINFALPRPLLVEAIDRIGAALAADG